MTRQEPPLRTDWATALDPSGATVASFVPDHNEAVIRILNPAYSATGDVLSWRQVGGPSFSPRSDLQWNELTRDLAHPVTTEPAMGTVDRHITSILVPHLAVDDSPVVTAQWEGYADVEPDRHALLRIVDFPPRRPSVVRATTGGELTRLQRVPMRWWHPDLRWVVGNDIYARSIFLSADQATITAILATPRLEAFAVSFSDPVTPEDL